MLFSFDGAAVAPASRPPKTVTWRKLPQPFGLRRKNIYKKHNKRKGGREFFHLPLFHLSYSLIENQRIIKLKIIFLYLQSFQGRRDNSLQMVRCDIGHHRQSL